VSGLPRGALIDNKYRVVRTLGEGGMGVVYIAEHTFLKKPVALKLLRNDVASEAGMAARFEQEARATSLIEHDNVVRVHDFGKTSSGELYLVMELLDGGPLAQELMQHTQILDDRAAWITGQVLAGLEAAHQQGVVHRDLKPDNVFITSRPNGTESVKIVDFGIAKLRSDVAVSLTMAGSVIGTPQYMSPEQARGQPDVDHRADLYSVGVMLYRMLAGRLPFRSENYNVLLFEILTGQPTTLKVAAPNCNPQLAAFVMKAMTADREQRYQSAADMREALAACMPDVVLPASALPAVGSGGVTARNGQPVMAASGSGPARRRPLAEMDVSALELVPLDEAAGNKPNTGPTVADVPGPGPNPGPEHSGPPPISITGTKTDGVIAAVPAQSSAPITATAAATAARASAPGGPPVEDAAPISVVKPPHRPRPRTITAKRELPSRHSNASAQPAYLELNHHRAAASSDGFSQRVLTYLGVAAAILAVAIIYRTRNAVVHVVEHPKTAPSRSVASVQLTGVPAHAFVYLDGVRTLLNPVELPLSTQLHELHVECEGFEPRTITFVADRSQVLDSSLVEPPPPPPSPLPKARRKGTRRRTD
jgi:serine/threonine-protein kinase